MKPNQPAFGAADIVNADKDKDLDFDEVFISELGRL